MIYSCVPCRTGLKVQKIGVLLVETAGPDQKPYKFFQADLLECPICGAETVYTDARPDHCSTMKQGEIDMRILLASAQGDLYVSHEFPAGNDFNNYLAVRI